MNRRAVKFSNNLKEEQDEPPELSTRKKAAAAQKYLHLQTQGTLSVCLDVHFKFIFIYIFICDHLLSSAELQPLFGPHESKKLIPGCYNTCLEKLEVKIFTWWKGKIKREHHFYSGKSLTSLHFKKNLENEKIKFKLYENELLVSRLPQSQSFAFRHCSFSQTCT